MKSSADTKKKEGWGESLRMIIYAVLIALVVRAFLFQPFNIPSSSMVPTLLVGDYLFVSKYAYGYSKHSLPFSPPLFDGRILAREPERGDVIVFKVPSDNRTDYIKRLIGLPGDTIQMRHGQVVLNGEPVPRERVGDFVSEGPFGQERAVPQYRETLPNGVSYMTLDTVPDGMEDNTGVYEVPEGHYFMMGDNRDNSRDSRVPGAVGYVPFENLVGRAEIIFFSTNGEAQWWQVWEWPMSVRWGRLFDWIN